jgi:hypothetical protein
MAGDLIQGDEPNRAHPDPDQPLPASFDALDSDWRGYTNQGYWVTWMEQNLADLVDAYSIRIYWDAMSDMPPHPLKFESRLAPVTVDDRGTVTIDVPQHGVFALITKPIPPQRRAVARRVLFVR